MHFQFTPICTSLYARSTAILKHFAEAFPGSKEEKELEAAWHEASSHRTSVMWRYSRAMFYFYCLNYVLIVLLWLSSGLGAVCMSMAQPANH